MVAIGFLTLTTLESRRLAWTVVAAAAVVLAFWLWSVWGRRLRAPARKWRRRLLYSGVGLASIVLALLNGLPEVVEQWVTGGSTEELQLGFTTMAWWGRIGKVVAASRTDGRPGPRSAGAWTRGRLASRGTLVKRPV
ncbi:hypothetical protein [Nonomuraea sp. GTA35]|uniref:hypothetical protein n=1 Tax=Nonomuraea sp. GTA35 TaxID=1676746 RepID=UPI0035C171F2